MKKLVTVILAVFPLVSVAQEGRILYDYSVKYDYEIPEAWASIADQIPTSSFATMKLVFNGVESLMTVAPVHQEETQSSKKIDSAGKRAGAVARLKMISPSRKDQETQLGVYMNQDEGIAVESMKFMGRRFLIRGELPEFAWSLSGEEGEYLGFAVQKATAVTDSSNIEAWFTTEIPTSGGPGLFRGLPGTILAVSIDDGQITYSATEVNLDGRSRDVIEVPTEGKEISRDEYEQIVVEKLEEIRRLRNSRRRGVRR